MEQNTSLLVEMSAEAILLHKRLDAEGKKKKKDDSRGRMMMDESVNIQVQWREKDSLKKILGYRMFFFWISALAFSSQSSLLWENYINEFWITESITNLQTVLILFLKCNL